MDISKDNIEMENTKAKDQKFENKQMLVEESFERLTETEAIERRQTITTNEKSFKEIMESQNPKQEKPQQQNLSEYLESLIYGGVKYDVKVNAKAMTLMRHDKGFK